MAFKQFPDLLKKYPHHFAILSFICGFLFDVAMVSNVDDWHAIVQQAVYLSILLFFLLRELKPVRPSTDPNMTADDSSPPTMADQAVEKRSLQERINAGKSWVLLRSELIAHFLLGTLLNVYSIFFFKSASFAASFGFFIFMLMLLIANELQAFRKFGFALRFGLWTLCLISFSVILAPVALGQLSFLAFLIGILTACAIWLMVYWYARNTSKFSHKKILPSLAIFVVFILMYALQLLPPVPLSAKELAVYYKVERADDKYQIETLRQWWQFWLRGDQNFYARVGDKVSIFARINAPSRFRDQMQLRWQYQERNGRWVTSDTIPFNISGGRENGFRGHAFKENYFPGKWRVLLEASDGREVSRLDFEIFQDAAENSPREFQTLYR